MKPFQQHPTTDTALRVLILEDDPDHAFVLQHRLQRDRGNCIFLVAPDEATFKNALNAFSPQLILADNSLPAFDAIAALHAARDVQPSIPFILVTSALSEEQTVDFLHAGGDDCIDKIKLSRLCSSVDAALARRKKTSLVEKSERQHNKRQEIFHSYLECSPDGLLALDDHGYIMYINEAGGRLLSGKTWTPAGNLIWDVFPGLRGSFFEASLTAIRRDPQPLTVRLYAEASQCWLDCFFQPSPNGLTVVVKDVTSEETLRCQLRELQARMPVELERAVVMARQQERRELGQELHDNINQLLTSTNLFLTLINDAPGRITELMPYCRSSVHKALEENRRIAHGLASADGNIDDFLSRVEDLCSTMLRPAGMEIDFRTEAFDESAFSMQLKLSLYRILQEHFTNILRHSKANRISLRFKQNATSLEVVVADNGMGAFLHDGDGVGLRSMKRRTEELGGQLQLHTSPGNGFTVEVKVPV